MRLLRALSRITQFDRLEAAFLSATGTFAYRFVSAEFDARFTPAVEIGWRLAHEFWGQGLAPEGARAALASGFGELPLKRDCVIHGREIPSIRDGKKLVCAAISKVISTIPVG